MTIKGFQQKQKMSQAACRLHNYAGTGKSDFSLYNKGIEDVCIQSLKHPHRITFFRMSFLYFFFRGFVSGEMPDSTSGCLTCNIRYFTHEIIIFLSMKIIFFSLLTKEGLDPYFIHLVM